MSRVGFAEAMAVPDAHLLWLSAKDQFLVYAFDGVPDVAAGVEQMKRRARCVADLRLRVLDDHRWRYPRWVAGDVGDDQFVVHAESGDWRDALGVLVGLDQLDPTRMAWRVHVVPPTVVVVQIAHVLADGTRSAALAGALLGRRGPLPPLGRPDRGFLPWRAVVAARGHARMTRDVREGRLAAAPSGSRPALSVNARPAGVPVLRTLILDRDSLRRPTVTVGALVAIAEALGGYLSERGEDVGALGAEVPMADDARPVKARNNFRNVSVGLHPELSSADRATAIAAELTAHRARGRHPAMRAAAAAFAATPAPLLRWGDSRFDPGARSATVAGHTVVSSVHRGPADLLFGGSPVRFTAGFPALSPMMSLTHGVHGIGDTVAVSVHADSGNVDVDAYLQRLADALGCEP